jgi:hypothetical protein
MKHQVLRFYEEIWKYYGAYHNHKETCAWAAIVLHFIFCSGIAKSTFTTPSSVVFSVILTLLLLIECGFILIYMWWQFALKDHAGAVNAAAIAL